MLVSLLHNNANADINIYILTEGLLEKNIKIIEQEISAKGGTVQFCLIDSSVVSRFPMPKIKELNHISRATYYRLLISDLLPDSIDKILYLDCDMIINSSIEELWNTNLDGFAIAASKQIGSGSQAERLGYPIEYGYFNAGMTLMNLKYFRDNRISLKLVDYLTNNSDKIKFHDQDALNAVLYDKYIPVLPQWNMTSIVYTYKLERRGDSRNGKILNEYQTEKDNAISHLYNPSILHYVSKPKPWQKNCVHPLYHLYYDYADLTINFSNLPKQSQFTRTIAILKNKLLSYSSYIKQKIRKTDPTLL